MRFTLFWILGVSSLAMAGQSGLPDLSAEQIIEKHVAARGGLENWRKIESMVWVGHVERSNAPMPNLPFVLEMKRPDKTRFEIKAQNQLSLRVFDGANGWKLRPSAGGAPEVQPYTPEELAYAKEGLGLDGPLMDHAAKGVAVALDGVEEVEGRKAWHLKLRLPSGARHDVWIDGVSFLEVKHARESGNGQSRAVVVYRNFRTQEGLQMPFMIESDGETGKAANRMVIDRITLNPLLEDRLFAKPRVPGQRRGITVDTRSPPPARRTSGGLSRPAIATRPGPTS